MIEKSDALRLAELLCARLCHDLAGPIGTLVGALDLVREQHPDSEEAALAEEAAGDIAQRLKMLRAAWSQTTEQLDRPRLASLAANPQQLESSDWTSRDWSRTSSFRPRRLGSCSISCCSASRARLEAGR